MEHVRIGFVVLHYCAADMTRKSVASIQEKLKNTDYAIVVVDNASGNGTGKELAEEYKDDSHVTVLLSDENLGFARGNNLGYVYAKEELACDFICVMNNDVMILQDNFAELIVKAYQEHGFGVMGPHIELKDGSENAMYYEIAPLESLRKERDYYRRRLSHITSPLHGLWNIWDNLKLALRILLGKLHIMPEMKRHEDQVEGAGERQQDLILHGCCLIFSPVYLQRFADAFDPVTFMFREEELLYLRCRDVGLKVLYEPALRVLHLEDIATDFMYKTERKKEIFHLENQIDSMGILIERLERNGNRES